MSHGVLAKLVAKLLDEQSQLSGGLGLLLQELITEAGNVLLDLLQLAYNAATIRACKHEQILTCMEDAQHTLIS